MFFLKLKIQAVKIVILSACLCGFIETTFAQEVDYQALAEEAYRMDPNRVPQKVLTWLKPYENDANNKNGAFFSLLALAYKKTGNLEKAIWAYKRSIDFDPDDPTTHYNIGIAYYQNKQLEEALRHIAASDMLRPGIENSKAWINFLTEKIGK